MTTRRTRRAAVWLLAVLLLAAGLLLALDGVRQYEGAILENEDRQLTAMAQAIVRNADALAGAAADALTAVVEGDAFGQAEAARAAGDGAPMARLLEEAARRGGWADAILAEGGRVAVSAGGDTYALPAGTGMGDPAVALCTAGGAPYLAVSVPAGEATAAALLDPARFFEAAAGPADGPFVCYLLDAGGQLLLHNAGGRFQAEPAEQAARMAGAPLALRLRSQGGADFFEATRNGESYTARMAVVPASGAFAAGVAADYGAMVAPLRAALLRLMAFGVLTVAAAALLAALTVRTARQHDLAQRELTVLRRKNEAIQALNRQTNELAHHQRLETIGTLTSSIAHEFNNLLTPIMGYSILALEQLPQEETELYDNILEIYDASRKAKDIIARLSALSRKTDPAQVQPLSPDALVRRVLDTAAPARPARVAVETRLHSGDLRILGNETQLCQMLLNLLLNAFQAMEDRGGVVTVEAEADGDWARFRVSDNGPGIPAAIRDRIFQPFFTTKEAGRGTGLGLAIVQQVVESHGGVIAVEEAPGGGARFTIHLPAAPEA